VPTDEVSDLDEYVFVVRARIGEQSSILSVFNAKEDALDRNTGDPAFFIDVKSKGLADVLRTVLRDVRGISLEEDAPTV